MSLSWLIQPTILVYNSGDKVGAMGMQEAMRIWVYTGAVLNPKNTTQDIERKDVFSLIVRASEKDSEFKLSDTRWKTDIGAMVSTIGSIGLYLEVQEEVHVHQQVMKTFEDFLQLEKMAYAFHEALRLLPAGHPMIRESSENTVLSDDGEPGMRQVPIPKGLPIIVDMTGIVFKLTEWKCYGWQTVQHVKFDAKCSIWRSSGDIIIRTTFLTRTSTTLVGGRESPLNLKILSHSVLIVESIMDFGQTREQWLERVMQADVKMSLSVKLVLARLKRRQAILLKVIVAVATPSTSLEFATSSSSSDRCKTLTTVVICHPSGDIKSFLSLIMTTSTRGTSRLTGASLKIG
ncbi:hypothetical protein B0F90DRAFT_1826316 [Multifurca ochricompacta]|uniref:Uncharacterized protein n=1 Tax=Multifurca ochricompacta TaxID=376703 RepID=A0AAD4QIP6_9AGAM|nr:hypothetical protein B0F90DRAFT_1826316 [Multifurca ochricompacta]